MTETILAVDNDVALLSLIKTALEARGFSVELAASGEQALEMFYKVAPDLVILDIMMPGMDGQEVCRRLRQVSPVPIIFLTAVDTLESIVTGLTGGADDYLSKPFKVAELTARVNALLRRARMPTTQPDVMRFGDGSLVINRQEQTVFAHNKEVPLSPIEYNLLLFMAERAGRLLPTEFLHDAVWGSMSESGPDSVKWYIWRLRQKIELVPESPQFILTERGKGYRFSPQ
ncbi:MAG: response regulator transcription factor [Anaerolineae bacterium]|nr:response regulator transcription factor [Anaerolineae bacterium]